MEKCIFFLWQLPKPDDLAVVCYTSGTTGTCHCITDFGVDPNGHLQRHTQPLEILSLENVSFAALLPCNYSPPHPHHTQVNLSPNHNVCVVRDIKLRLMWSTDQQQSLHSNAAHLIITFILSDEIMLPETVSHTMVFRRKIIVGFWRKFWAKFQTEAEKSWKVNIILDKQENWKISTVSMGDFRIS